MLKRVVIFMFVVSAAGLFSGCGEEKGEAVAEDKPSKASLLADAERLKAAACACTDVGCGDKVFDEMSSWYQRIKDVQHVMTPAEEQNMEKIGFDLGLCLVKAGVDPKKLEAL